MTTSIESCEDAPYAPPSGQPQPRRGFWRRFLGTQASLVVSVYVLFAFLSASSVFVYDGDTSHYASTIVFAILATMWAINDSRMRGGMFPPILRMLYLFFCPASLVMYLAATRGFRGIGLILLHCVGVIVVMSLAFYGMFYAVYFTGHWELMDPIYLEY